VGFDSIDVAAATALRIPVMISATANFESVAEHVLGLMLSLAKDLPRMTAGCIRDFGTRPNTAGWSVPQGPGADRVRPDRPEGESAVAPLQMKILISDPYIPEESIPPGFRGFLNWSSC